MRREKLVTFRECILDIWENEKFIFETCIAEDYPSFSDARCVDKWVHGLALSKANLEYLSDSPEMEMEMPFLYISDDFIEPFVGIYLLNITDTLISGFGIDFSMIHFANFLISDRFLPAFSSFPFSKKWAVFLLLNAFIPSLCDANVSVFSDNVIHRLESLLSDIIRHELN